MTTKYPTLFFAGLLLCLTACKKNDNIINAQLVGKWNVNKIVIHIVSSASSLGAVHDTTYSGSAFNASDYMQFNSNYTASLSTSILVTPEKQHSLMAPVTRELEAIRIFIVCPAI